jgi:hypothetical protein
MEAVITDRKPEAPWRLYSLTENQRPHETCNHSLKTIYPMAQLNDLIVFQSTDIKIT